MKYTILISIILVIFAVLSPFLFYSPEEPAEVVPDESPSPSIKKDYNVTSSPSPYSGTDENIDVSVLIDGTVENLTMDEYLTHVVAAEMPVSFELEALKAQAVAARTYTLYKMTVEPSEAHPNAHVCGDINCCKAYVSFESLQTQWGDNYDDYLSKISEAVAATDGVVLVYEDEPILAVFHSSSYVVTENSENVWGSALPYLRSVKSPETEEEVPDYNSTVQVSYDDFSATIRERFPDVTFSEDPDSWIANDMVFSGNGRLMSVTIGGVSVKGTELRELFELRSASMSISTSREGVLFSVRGYGHGVGMSQYGANALAKEGKEYADILRWYYTDALFANAAEYRDEIIIPAE